MTLRIRSIFTWAWRTLACLVALVVLYLVIEYNLGVLTCNDANRYTPTASTVRIYLTTNGVHTDLVVPYRHAVQDWSHFLAPLAAAGNQREPAYVSFGWGDKGFYLNTPTWDDLTFPVAFNALFGLSTTAMHVMYFDDVTSDYNTIAIDVPLDSYKTIVGRIEHSFELTSDGSTDQIADAHYSSRDQFYEATGTYNLFYTCNTWTNSVLCDANLPCCTWTAFEDRVMGKYR